MEGEGGKDVEDICQKVITKLGHVIQADQTANYSQKEADGIKVKVKVVDQRQEGSDLRGQVCRGLVAQIFKGTEDHAKNWGRGKIEDQEQKSSVYGCVCPDCQQMRAVEKRKGW